MTKAHGNVRARNVTAKVAVRRGFAGIDVIRAIRLPIGDSVPHNNAAAVPIHPVGALLRHFD